MKISTKTRYGLRAMADLANNYKGRPVLIRHIAERQNISGRYLEQIMLSLKKAGLVESVSGAKGGYMLTKTPSSITTLDIVETLEGPLSFLSCIDYQEICNRSNYCTVKELWTRIKKSIVDILKSTTLKDLAEDKNTTRICYRI